MEFYDILRSLTTNVMMSALLFTLAQPKYRKWTLWTALSAIALLDLAMNVFFYLRNDYSALAAADILFFILVGAAVKPLFRETLMQWLFNCFTAMNIYAIAVIISYHLCDFFPHPYYAITMLRALLFAAAILLFRKRLRPLYRQAAEHWSVYLFVSVGLFMNFAWYFVGGDNVEQMLTDQVVPLVLLIVLVLLVYLSIFLSLRKTLRETALREENLKMQSERELVRQRLTLMDEAVRQMSVVQHDRRHFNHTLSYLLREGETAQAIILLDRQTESLPQKPQTYCENVSVNAAVSYYAEQAKRQGIRCDIRLNISQTPGVDELSLAMVVSNLMENAIHAVSALPEEQRTLRFTAVDTGQLLLELTNPYVETVTLDENNLPTARAEGHGRGTQSVAAFVKRCSGELVYHVSDGVFKVQLLL